MNQFRPLTDVYDMADQLSWVKTHPSEAQAMAEKAREWVQGLSWDVLGEAWRGIFSKASELRVASPQGKLGPNDPCPECAARGVAKKWKRCAVHNTAVALIK